MPSEVKKFHDDLLDSVRQMGRCRRARVTKVELPDAERPAQVTHTRGGTAPVQVRGQSERHRKRLGTAG